MNSKRILTLALFGVLASFATPAFSAVNSTAAVTVQWNTTYTVAMNVVTNYNPAAAGCAATASTACVTAGTAPLVYANVNTGSGTCAAPASETNTSVTGASGGPGAGTAQVTLGNISPDNVKWTDCYYADAIDAMVTTTDGNGYTGLVGAGTVTGGSIAGAGLTNYNICIFPTQAAANNNKAKGSTLTGPGNPNATPGQVGPTAGAVPAVTANTAVMCTGASPDGQAGFVVGGSNAAQGTILAATGAGGQTTGTHLDFDVEVGIGPAFQCAVSPCQVSINFEALGT